MNKFLAAVTPSGGQIYFVFDEDFDGLITFGEREEKISFWSFISKRNDIELLNDTKLQKELSSLKWNDEKWLRKFCAKDADFLLAVQKFNAENNNDSKNK